MPDSILDKIDLVRLGRELQTARKQARLTQEDAARMIGVARTTLTAIENGERRVKEGELISLARAYGRQLSDFVRQRPPLETVEVSQAQFRGPYLRTDEDAQAIEPYLFELQELCRDYLELEQITNAPLIRKYPVEYDLGHLAPESAAAEVADEERNRLRLGDGPLYNLRGVLEGDVGLRIFFMPLQPSSKFSAVYLYTEALGGCIAVNSLQENAERWRMSLAHEYGHFLTTRYKPEVLSENGYQRLPESERFASLFAMHFLIPANGLRRRLKDIVQAHGQQNISVAMLVDLAHQYGVSVQGLVSHMEMLRIAPTGMWDSLKHGGIKVRKIQEEIGLHIERAHADLLPQRYKSLAIQAFVDGLITEGHLAKFLRIGRTETRRLTESFLTEDEENDEAMTKVLPGSSKS